jgi:hypothetical protein
MRFFLKLFGVLIGGTVLGLAATWFTVVRGAMPGGLENGVWATSLATGSAQGDSYTRAAVALHGLLALNRRETIYFTASRDASGAALDGHCRYVVAGRDPDARWWSVTAYGADDYLIPNPENRYSVGKTDVERDAQGRFAIAVGGPPGNPNRIALAPGHFTLTLRLYNPGADVALDPGQAELPTVTKAGC